LRKNFLVPGEIPLGALAFRYRLDSEQLPHFLWPQQLALSNLRLMALWVHWGIFRIV
jgi:hypothetical protein